MPIQSVAANFEGAGKADVLMFGPHGKLLLLHGSITSDHVPPFKSVPVSSQLLGIRHVVGGPIGTTKRNPCPWLHKKGGLWDILPTSSMMAPEA